MLYVSISGDDDLFADSGWSRFAAGEVGQSVHPQVLEIAAFTR